ncbi:efflux RND transporter periplasmic adaptor subunit [Sphingoaurantiacus capsulatus]|uniref:Efflux RND transporter periplasmic adaptor subunit n=1 Tax=Sphingoaurantiacus capsulatus TaxID=1771310 RepID=A0ABV7X465_9SPHN
MRRALPLLSAALLAACGGEPEAPPAMPPVEVEAITVSIQPITNLIELPGRVQAVRTAEVRARVDGIVERRVYEEGTDVRAGTPLFRIDSRPLRAAQDAASAALRRAQAEQTNARRDVERFRPLVERNAISEQEFDAAVARAAQAEADVGSARAQLEQARLNLGYATVTAPIAGRAGRAEITEGALVSASQGTLMATVEQLDPMYVNFSQSSTEVLRLRRDMQAGRLKMNAIGQTRVTLILEDNSVYERSGVLDFADQSVDPSTGTVSLRAEFPNPRRILLPGEFVRARIEAGVRPDGILIPQKAVQLSTNGASVMTIDAKGMATPRPVKVGELRGGLWVIREGLKAGDRVITEGLQKVQPGAPVTVAGAKPPAAAKPAAAPAQGQ